MICAKMPVLVKAERSEKAPDSIGRSFDSNTISDAARPVFFAIGYRPVLASAAAKLVKTVITPAVLSAASTALGEELNPQEDQQASASMRRHLAKVLLARCVSSLLGRPDLSAGGPS